MHGRPSGLSDTLGRRAGAAAAGILGLALLALPASGQLSQQFRATTAGPGPMNAAVTTWSFDETTSGNDISWTSPTSVDPGAALYNTVFTVTTLDVSVSYLGIPFGPISLLGELPPELQSAVAAAPGPAPIALIDEPIDYPGAPEPSAVALTLSSGLDANGFGFFEATDVVLGTTSVNLGFPFGTVTVQIESIRMAGTLSIHATWFDLGHAFPGTFGNPVLSGEGTLNAGDPVTLTLGNTVPTATAWFVVGLAADNLPFSGGVLVPSIVPPGTFLPLPTDLSGSLVISGPFPAGVPADFEFFFQYWIVDAGAAFGFAGSNALRAVAP